MLLTRVERSLVVLSAVICFLFLSTHAFAQYNVDCTGTTPGAYTTINSVIPLLNNGSVVRITGTCTENVNIYGLNNLNIGAPWGQTANLQGNLNINGVQNLFLYGLNVTNPSGDGIDINHSFNVTLENCTSSNNGNFGLNVGNSVVSIQNTGAFNNNGNYGVNASGITDLSFSASAGPISVNNNVGGGITLQDGVMNGGGNMIVNNNTAAPSTTPQLIGNASGYGILLQGHARAVFYVWDLAAGPNVISGNQAGGIAIHEGSEISLSGSAPSGSGPWQTNVLNGNGPVAIYAGLGSQLTLWNGVQITNHADAGVDAYGHSEVFIAGDNQITNNGTGSPSTYPTRAGVRVDGNSEAYIRGGQISQNGGPGILALANSSVDISGATLTSNARGPIECDSSSWLVGDQTSVPETPYFALPCRVPNSFGPRFHPHPTPPIPNISHMKAQEAKYQQLMSSF